MNLFQQHPEALSSHFHIGEILVFSTPSCFCHTSYFKKGFILNTYTAISDTAHDRFQLHLYLGTTECVYSSIFTVTNEHCTTTYRPNPFPLKWGESMEEKPHWNAQFLITDQMKIKCKMNEWASWSGLYGLSHLKFASDSFAQSMLDPERIHCNLGSNILYYKKKVQDLSHFIEMCR